MKLLIDMNLSPSWVDFLELHGFSAVHWSSLGPASAPDSEIIDYAVRNGFVVFTHDLDFGRLLAMSKSTAPSVIQMRTHDVLPSAIGSLVLSALKATRPQLEAGALVTVDPAHQRIRLLPFSPL